MKNGIIRGLDEIEQPAPGRYFPALDGIRGLAILGVLMTHAVTRFPGTGSAAYWYNQFLDLGANGVELFFVLSGFLITGILLDTKEGGGAGYFRNFYARRFLRLFPVYYAYLATVAIVVPAFHRAVHTSMVDFDGNWLWYVLYLSNLKANHAVGDPNLGHFWSLAVEEQYYLVWPAVVLLLSRRRLTYCCFASLLLALGFRCYFSLTGSDWNTLYRLTPMRIDSLAMGALGAIAVRSGQRIALKKAAWVALPAGLVLFLSAVVMAGSVGWHNQEIQTWGNFGLTVAFGALIFLAVSDAWIIRLFSRRALMMFGKYSYTIYVIHILVVEHLNVCASFLAKRIGPLPYWGQLATAALIVGVTYGIAAVSWRYFEQPILAFKRHFSSAGPQAPSLA